MTSEPRYDRALFDAARLPDRYRAGWVAGCDPGPDRAPRSDPHGHAAAGDGRWEATRQIKAAPTTRTIPVVALTAYAMDDERQRCLEAGCDDYETKPLVFPRLLKKLQSLLSMPAA